MAGSDTKPELNFLENGGIVALEIEQLRTRNQQLRERNTELQRIAEIGWSAEKELRGLRTREADLADQVDALKTENRTQTQKIANLAAHIETLNSQIESVKNEASRVRAAIETQARAKLAQMKTEYGERLREFQRESEIRRGLEKRIEDLAGEVERAQAAQQAAETRATAAESESRTRAEERAETEERLNATLAVLRERQFEIERLNAQNRDKSALIEELEGALDETGREFAAKLAEHGEVVENFSVERERLEQALAFREFEAAELERAVAHWRTSADKEESERRSAECALHVQMNESRHLSAKQSAEIESLKAEAAELTSRLEAALATIADKSEDAARAAFESEERAKVILNQARQLENRESKVAQLAAEVENLRTHVSEWRDSALDARAEAEEFKLETQRQLARISEMSASAMEKDAELRALRAAVEERDTKSRALERAAAEAEAERDAVKAAMRRQVGMLANLTRADREKEAELQRIRLQEGGFEKALADLRATCAENEKVIKNLDEALAHQRESFQKELREQKWAAEDKITEARARFERDMREKIAAFESERSLWTRELEDAREERAQLVESYERRLKQSVDTVTSADEYIARELQRLSAHMHAREVQLRSYAASISSEKAEVLTCAKQLSDEIRSAKTLSPLKDYLSVTEFELSKIELQLKKTPAVSLDRPRLESTLAHLLEQRDFLKKAIESSEKQLERQARALARIARPERLAAVPPLPPKS